MKKRYRFLLATFSLFILITLIQDSFAKYVTNANANTNISIARWNILVNNQDITSNSNFSNTITPVFPGTEHIAAGIIAPLSEGYFDIILNYSEVDVSFNKTINLNHHDSNTIQDLIFVGYSINGGNMIEVNDRSLELLNTVSLNDLDRIRTYRFYVKWLDGEGELMDNEADTIATRYGNASIRVGVNFTQIPN